jgi:hypothetical protein
MATLTFNSKVTSIGSYAFYNCSKVKSIPLPSTLETIGSCAFCNNSLTSLTIPTSVTGIEDHAFANNTSLTALSIPGNVTTIGSYAFSGCSNIATLALNYGIESIGDYAFQNLKISTVTVPSSVTSIGSGAFKGCNSLVSISLPFVGSSNSITSYGSGASYKFGYIFGYTSSNASGTTYDGYGYYYYIPSSLRTVTITNATGVSARAFSGCSSFTIHAPAGSYAETYAKGNHIHFVAE